MTNHRITEKGKWLTAENDFYRIKLNKWKGLTIKELVFKNQSKTSLLGTLDHGFYDDISLGADYYSGHAIIERPGEHKVTDLQKLSPEIEKNDDGIILKNEQVWNRYSFNSSIQLKGEKIILQKSIVHDTDEKAIIRPYNFTMNPRVWERDSLYIATHNGGAKLEKFRMVDQKISHGDIYSTLISARHGFGNTEGLFVIGDKNKSINFECDMSISALIPSIIYKEMDGTFFFRLQYSAREMDETLMKKRLKLHTKLIIHG